MDHAPLALIIEDNEDQNLVFTKALETAGYATESILDGIAAQKRLNEVVPEMVILDLHLPGSSGSTILAQIRRDARLASTRVILATADAAFADLIQSQADAVLLKPISFAQLSMLASRYRDHPKVTKV